MQKFIVVIPARMASGRLPGKPLININGISLIRRTYLQTIKAVDPKLVYVATDHDDIVAHCNQYDMQVVLTSPECLTGTDRVAEVARSVNAEYYINVQGDEPLMNPDDILKTMEAIHAYPGDVINGYASIHDPELYVSLTIPKVVFRPDGRLLYMSRSPIPGNKAGKFMKSWRQVCVYAFPQKALFAYASRTSKTPLEEMEDLEILRFLEMGYEVRMIELSQESIAVDTPGDVEKVISALNSHNN